MNNFNQFDSVWFKCKNCDTEWQSRKPIKPAECPNCRSPHWNVGSSRSSRSLDKGAYINARMMLQKLEFNN